MKKILLSVVAIFAATSAFAGDISFGVKPVFGPAKPPVKEGTGTFKAQSRLLVFTITRMAMEQFRSQYNLSSFRVSKLIQLQPYQRMQM